jgi:hypothetical protein
MKRPFAAVNPGAQPGIVGLLVCAALLTSSARADGQHLVSIGRPFFGMHFFYAGASLRWPGEQDTPIPEAVGSWRLWNAFGSEWANLEPRRGQWDFRLLDHYVALGRANNLELLLTLGETPRWASARPDEQTGAGAGRAAEPRRLEDWEDYVRVVASRYKGRIKYYEVWNEPAFSDIERTVSPQGRAGFFSGSSRAMVELARRAHSIVREVDPAARIVSPSMAGQRQGVKRLDAFLSAGGGSLIDIVGFHFYQVDTTEPERLPALVEQVRQTMAKHGIADKPLWNTEAGLIIARGDRKVVPLEPNGIGVLSHVLTPRDAAARMARFLLLGASAGIERYFWFAWDSGSMGLSDLPGPKTRRVQNSVGVAYGTVARWMTDAQLRPCRSAGDDTWVCELLRRERSAWVVWRPSGVGRWRPPADGSPLAVEYLDGRSEDASGGEVAVGPGPVLVKRRGDPWMGVR